MRKALIALALVAFVAVQAYAASAGMQVPAVVANGEGQMILLNVEVENGSGNIYTSTDPLVGMDTQESERKAVEVAMRTMGRNASLYDVFLTMNVGDTRQVDGPSAGAAMTILTISAVEGRPLRSDFTITGTIEDSGGIGPVGGVFTKVEAASREGKRIALVPRESDASDKMALASLMARLNITVVEVGNITEAADVAFSAEGTVPRLSPPQPPAPLSLSAYSYDCPGCGIDGFRSIAGWIVNRTAGEVDAVGAKNASGTETILPLLRKQVADSREMLDKGYLYTAANTAFLNLVDAEVVMNATMNRTDLGLLISSVDDCIRTTDRGRLTRENLDWRVGADLRAMWAKNKIDDVKRRELGVKDNEEMFVLYKDALLARTWCEVSKQFYEAAAETGGTRADEGSLRNLALTRVGEADRALAASGDSDSDLQFHLLGAKTALNASQYGAAVYDSDYVLGSLEARNLTSGEDDAVISKANGFAARKGKSLWAALFFAHAAYYNATNGGAATVARLGFIADRYENDTAMMRVLFENPNAVPAPSLMPPSYPPAQEDTGKLNESLIVVIVLLSILLITSAILNLVVYTRAITQAGRRAEKPAKPRPARRK